MLAPNRHSERGIAMVVALFTMLALSVVATAVMAVSQTETRSSHNYRLMSQARYGAESGIHAAANYLLNTYTAPTSMTGYGTTVSPVTYNNAPVVLSSKSGVSSNYPVTAVITAFTTATASSLTVDDDSVDFTAVATLKSMRQITDVYSGSAVTIQTWEITGDGTLSGATTAAVEVTATIERQTVPIFSYAAFATYNGCAALSFAGGATTNSYSSTAALVGGYPVLSNTFGNVGTNGNLTEVGNPTIINGSLSTPRSGVGQCTANNITAQTISGGASVTSGLIKLSQEIQYPTPATPNPLPPTTNQNFTQSGGCPGSVPNCTVSANGATITPGGPGSTIYLGNVTTNGNAIIHLNAGTYVVNSLKMNGSSKVVIDSGPVVFKIAGVGDTNPLVINGNGIVNTTFKPTDLEFVYGGTGEVKLAGGEQTSALIYAPQATASFTGGSDLYGAVVVKQLTATGGAAIHYDRNLSNSGFTAGNSMMSAFTWKSF